MFFGSKNENLFLFLFCFLFFFLVFFSYLCFVVFTLFECLILVASNFNLTGENYKTEMFSFLRWVFAQRNRCTEVHLVQKKRWCTELYIQGYKVWWYHTLKSNKYYIFVQQFDYCVLFEVVYHLQNMCATIAKKTMHAVLFTL